MSEPFMGMSITNVLSGVADRTGFDHGLVSDVMSPLASQEGNMVQNATKLVGLSPENDMPLADSITSLPMPIPLPKPSEVASSPPFPDVICQVSQQTPSSITNVMGKIHGGLSKMGSAFEENPVEGGKFLKDLVNVVSLMAQQNDLKLSVDTARMTNSGRLADKTTDGAQRTADESKISEKRWEQMEALMDNVDDVIDEAKSNYDNTKVFAASQMKQLHRIYLQVQSLNNPNEMTTLKLTDKQTKKVDAFLLSKQEEIGINSEKLQEMVEEIQQAVEDEAEIIKVIMESKNAIVTAVMKMMSQAFATQTKVASAGMKN